MNILHKIYENRTKVQMAIIFGVIGISLAAMFGAPMESSYGPSQIVVDGPSVILLILIGLAIGCYGTIVGIGGGPLIVPVLVFFYGWESEHLVATSLFIVFLNALSGSAGYARQKRIDYNGGIKFALAALPGAVLSGFVHHVFDIHKFNIVFGLFLIFLAVYSAMRIGHIESRPEIKSAKKKYFRFRSVRIVDRFGKKFNFGVNDSLGIGMNFLLGFFIGFLGIGGGVFQVPILIFLLYYPVHIATATSHFVTMLTCLIALIPHVFLGNIYFAEALRMGIGVVIGAQLGVWFSPKIDSKVITYLFVGILIIFAIKMFV